MTEEERPAIGVIGDFSGRGDEKGIQKERAEFRFIDIDRDNWGQVFQKLAPRVGLGLPFCGEIRFAVPEQFHPDEIMDRIPSMSGLLEARDHLDDPERMRKLIAEAGADLKIAEATASPAPSEVKDIAESELLDSMLEDRPPSPSVKKTSSDPLFDELIREIAEGSADRTDYKQQDRWRSAIDQELGRRMRDLLHHPAFQRLEALWRSLRSFLVQADFGDACRIRILDLTRNDLIDKPDGEQGDGLSALHRLVVEEEALTPGGDPFRLLVCDLTIEADPDDLRLLERIGEVALAAKTPFIAAAGDTLVDLDVGGDSEAARTWKEIRQAPLAEYLALAHPGILLRLPYGAETDLVERFAFDEGITGKSTGEYLWGNPAFAVAGALANAEALGTDPTQHVVLSGLPLHVFKADDEIHHSGPTKKLLTDTRILELVQRGFQPVAGMRGGDTARICSFQSLSG